MADLLFIPGLGGEGSLRVQRTYISLLNLFRKKHIYYFEPKWQSDKNETAEQKYKRLVDFYVSSGSPKIVYAVSAGGPIALRLAVDKDLKAHLVCAKLLGSEKIGKYYISLAPALKPMVEASQKAMKTKNYHPSNFTCYIPRNTVTDGVVETEDMLAPDAIIVNLPKFNHITAIIYSLFRYLPRV